MDSRPVADESDSQSRLSGLCQHQGWLVGEQKLIASQCNSLGWCSARCHGTVHSAGARQEGESRGTRSRQTQRKKKKKKRMQARTRKADAVPRAYLPIHRSTHRPWGSLASFPACLNQMQAGARILHLVSWWRGRGLDPTGGARRFEPCRPVARHPKAEKKARGEESSI